MSRQITRRSKTRCHAHNGSIAAVLIALSLAHPEHARAEQTPPRNDRPNILFILTDDQRWDAMSCMGHPFLKTPQMDRLATEGARLANAFVTTSLCSPSRACFLTGMHAHRHGVRTNESIDIRPDTPTFPQLLRQAGYETAFVGKWHMARKATPRPGFDYWLSFLGQGKYEDPPLNENGRDFKAKGYITDLLTDYAVKWLDKPRAKPFCLILSHKAVHGPFTPAQRHKGMYADVDIPKPASFDDTYKAKPEWYRRALIYGARRNEWRGAQGKPVPPELKPIAWNPRQKNMLDYDRALLAVDESVGKVLDALQTKGQLDNTVIVFAGDNGYFHGEHRRGDKRLIYEESMRIPFLIRYPKLIKPGTVIDQMTLNIDLAPTLLDLAGVPAPKTMQGRSMKPLLAGRKVDDWRKSFFYTYFQEAWVPGLPTMLAVRTADWKYARYPDLEDLDELYDLSRDRIEMHNLVADPAAKPKLEEMRAELDRLIKETGYRPAEQTPAARANTGPAERRVYRGALTPEQVARNASK
ncbi:MAG: sulfatase [Phycisphaerae bacterium]|nr:sulfatase [Phycisphaerae bacterium]